ncbi:hypothetical protein [uncultured Roseobacter sp.]|uniref:hypothetical protein n=1 Tax=uncultured Roseobacter sp. TaxID=114847 RepID=UPI002628A801|nr:hypothetical protein [uncultured Roseobacter sp.]
MSVLYGEFQTGFQLTWSIWFVTMVAGCVLGLMATWDRHLLDWRGIVSVLLFLFVLGFGLFVASLFDAEVEMDGIPLNGSKTENLGLVLGFYSRVMLGCLVGIFVGKLRALVISFARPHEENS